MCRNAKIGPIKFLQSLNWCLWLLLLCSLTAGSNDDLNVELLVNGKPAADINNSLLKVDEAFNIGFQLSSANPNINISGLHPGAWIRPESHERKSCKDAVRQYLSQGINPSQDVSLNGFSLITLNADHSIAIMDPRLDLATSNLIALTRLDSRVADWAMSVNQQALYVTLPDKQQLQVIDPVTGLIKQTIKLDSRPEQIEVLDQFPLLWVASENDGLVYLVDTRKQEGIRKFRIGSGRVIMAYDQGRQRLFAYSAGDGRLVVIDVAAQEKQFVQQLQPGFSGISYSSHSKQLYLADPGRDLLVSILPELIAKPVNIPLAAQSNRVQVAPNGWIFAFDGKKAMLNLVNPETQQLTQVLQFRHGFDQVFFSKQYAYIRHTDSANVSLINLASLAINVEPGVIEVPIGSNPPGTKQSQTLLSPVAVLPDGHSTIITNPVDRTLFLFMEGGMKVPMNAFKVWTEAPLAVLVHDRSLKEVKTGVYQTATRIRHAGKYEIVIYVPELSFTRCLPLTISQSSRSATTKKVKRYTINLVSKKYTEGSTAQLQFDIQDNEGMSPDIKKISVLLFRPGRNWQQRVDALRQADGHYGFSIVFPKAGEYKLVVQNFGARLDQLQELIQTILVSEKSHAADE